MTTFTYELVPSTNREETRKILLDSAFDEKKNNLNKAVIFYIPQRLSELKGFLVQDLLMRINRLAKAGKLEDIQLDDSIVFDSKV